MKSLSVVTQFALPPVLLTSELEEADLTAPTSASSWMLLCIATSILRLDRNDFSIAIAVQEVDGKPLKGAVVELIIYRPKYLIECHIEWGGPDLDLLDVRFR
jgi:hypothetical protein